MKSADAIAASESASRARIFQPTWLDAGFVLAGMITVLLGPILPALENLWKIGDARAGLLFTAQFSGSTAGVLASSWLVRRWGFRACIAAGYALAGAGVAAFGAACVASSWATGEVSAIVFGVGLGLVIPATNLLVAQSSGQRSAARLSWLNLAWGVGAVILPLLAGAFVKIGRLEWLLEGLAAAAIFMAILLASIGGKGKFPAAGDSSSALAKRLERKDIWALAILGALFSLQVGVETGLGGWLAAYARVAAAATPARGALAPLFFLGALLAGRALAPAVLRRRDEVRVAQAGLAVGALGGGTVIFSRAFAGIAVGAAVAGFGLAAVFPIVVSRFAARFAGDATRYGGFMFALGGAGGAVLPWMVGFSASRIGNLGDALWILVAALLLMIALFSTPAVSLLAQTEARSDSA